MPNRKLKKGVKPKASRSNVKYKEQGASVGYKAHKPTNRAEAKRKRMAKKNGKK